MTGHLQTFCNENNERIETVTQTFGTYQPHHVNTAKISMWLGQFDHTHYDLALRVLEAVEYYDVPRMQAMLQKLHTMVSNQLQRDMFAWDNIYFVPLGGPGESGHEILKRYRDVNRLHPSKLKLVSDLQKLVYEAGSGSDASNKGTRLAFVFLDDFVGSGKQVTDYWNDVLKQILSLSPRPAMYVACCVACEQGARRVAATPLRVIAVHYVHERLFLPGSQKFNADEKQTIRAYCDKAGNKPANVYLELMIAFTHGAPNNTLSVLRGSKGQRPWRGILPRYSDLP